MGSRRERRSVESPSVVGGGQTGRRFNLRERHEGMIRYDQRAKVCLDFATCCVPPVGEERDSKWSIEPPCEDIDRPASTEEWVSSSVLILLKSDSTLGTQRGNSGGGQDGPLFDRLVANRSR
jgi:hypothetical protein